MVLFALCATLILSRVSARGQTTETAAIGAAHLRAARAAPAGWAQWCAERPAVARSVAARAAALSHRSDRHAAFATLIGRALRASEGGAR